VPLDMEENCELCRQFYMPKRAYRCKRCGRRCCSSCMDGWKYACRGCNPRNEQLEPTVPLNSYPE
jgi:hypothetical protein